MPQATLPHRWASHPLLRVGLFTAAYLLLAIWGALRTGNREFVFYIAVMLVLIGCIAIVHARVRLTLGLLWLLSIWGALHMAGGLVAVPDDWPIHTELRVLYNWWIIPKSAPVAGEPAGWLKYDQAVHAFGFGVATWLCWQGIRGALLGRAGSEGRPRLRPTVGLMMLAATASMGLGALNEVIEFTATRFTETNVGGYVNTGWDLVYNAVGACLGALVIFLGSRRD